MWSMYSWDLHKKSSPQVQFEHYVINRGCCDMAWKPAICIFKISGMYHIGLLDFLSSHPISYICQCKLIELKWSIVVWLRSADNGQSWGLRKYHKTPFWAPELLTLSFALTENSSYNRVFPSEKQRGGSYSIITQMPSTTCGLTYVWIGPGSDPDCWRRYYSELVIHVGQHVSSCTGMPISHVQREKDEVLGLHLHPLSCFNAFRRTVSM